MRFLISLLGIIFLTIGIFYFVARVNKINTLQEFLNVFTQRSAGKKDQATIIDLKVTPAPNRFSIETPIGQGNPPTIQLVSAKTTFKVGETVVIGVKVSSGGNPATGATASLIYDFNVLGPIQDPNKVFITGFEYKELLPIIIPGQTNILIRLTAINKSGATVLSGNMAEITFKALQPGTITLKLIPDTQNTGSGSVIFGSKTNINLPTLTKDITITIE